MKEDIKICEFEGERFKFDLTKAEGRIHYLLHLYKRWETSLDYREVLEDQGALSDETRNNWDESLETGRSGIARILEDFGLTESDLWLHKAYTEMKAFWTLAYEDNPLESLFMDWRRRIKSATGVDPEDVFRYDAHAGSVRTHG